MEQLFLFLNNPVHRQYNKLLQINSYRSMMMPWGTSAERIKSLLYNISSTQAQPNIDLLADTFQCLHVHWNQLTAVTNIEQLADFAALLHNGNPAQGAPYIRLFRNLSAAPGFGQKTAALFIKSLIDIHTWDETVNLRFLQHFQPPGEDDSSSLPVDRVIQYIFREYVYFENGNPSFNRVNNTVQDPAMHGLYNNQHLTVNEATKVWDDLWFWGTFSQRMVNGQRVLDVNAEKFMCTLAAPHHLWPEIERHLHEFIALLQGLAPAAPPHAAE